MRAMENLLREKDRQLRWASDIGSAAEGAAGKEVVRSTKGVSSPLPAPRPALR